DKRLHGSFTGFCINLLTLCSFNAASFAAGDPLDNEGTEDHPEVSRFPGFHIDSSKMYDYNEFRFATESIDDSGQPKGEVKAGRYWNIVYWLNEGARKPSAIELVRNYENAFKKAGGGMVIRHPQDEEPESAVYRMPMPNGGERWLQIGIDSDGNRLEMNIVDVGAMVQKVEFSADEMAEALKKNGYIALTGILFDTGKADIKPESGLLLREVIALLNGDKSLNLQVDGHTDSVGDKHFNMELSRRRAESVVKYLTSNGIDSKRLRFDGKGDSMPVADNRSEEGRAKNRRVELVRF
ncbi:MAG: OmpA family protein, partial [Candidatus Omnitrophica bacterium]|nr:OmpA family protein [Candidatus Omnitrophota bacterium]